MLSIPFRAFVPALTIALIVTGATLPVRSADPPPLPKTTGPSIPPSLPPRAPAAEVELETEVDLIKLLNSELTMPRQGDVTDNIWTITPGEGRVIVRLPLKVTKPATAVRVSGAAVKIRGGRFICWQLIDPKEEARGGKPSGLGRDEINATGKDQLPENVPRMARAVELHPDGTISWKMDRTIVGAKLTEGIFAGPYVLKLNPAALNELNPGGPPRIVRNPNETPQDFLRRKAPLEEEYKRKVAEYRAKATQARELPDEFRGPIPPTLYAIYEVRTNLKSVELDGPAPLPWDFPLDLLLQLHRMGSPLGEIARPLDAPGATFTTQSPEKTILAALSGEKVHPYTLRLIAHGITSGGSTPFAKSFLKEMKLDDERNQIVDRILAAKDSESTNAVLQYLVLNPSEAATATLDKAMKAGLLDANAQLALVTSMSALLAEEPAQDASQLAAMVSLFLADPKGPPAAKLLEQVFKIAHGKFSTRNRLEPTAEAIAKRLTITGTGARRDEAITAIVEAAAGELMAMTMLDAQLLGSTDAALVERTLAIIARSVPGSIDLNMTDIHKRPLVPAKVGNVNTRLVVLGFWQTGGLRAGVTFPVMPRIMSEFGPQGVAVVGVNRDPVKEEADRIRIDDLIKSEKMEWPQFIEGQGLESELARRLAVDETVPMVILSTQGPTAGQVLWRGQPAKVQSAIREILSASASASPTAPADAAQPTPRLVNAIGIPNNEHAIFKLLADDKLRNLAWAALRHMRMTPVSGRRNDADQWASIIADKALGQTPTPEAAVIFLARHDEVEVPEAVIQIVIRGTAQASIAAARAIHGSEWDISKELSELNAQTDRFVFGMRFYEGISGEAIYAVGLLRDKAEGAKAVPWFARQIAFGRLPHSAHWIEPYETEDRLLQLANVSDTDLADGAVGTLVSMAGGSGLDTATIAEKLRANRQATIPELTAIWNTARRELFTAKLKAAPGNYQLIHRTRIQGRAAAHAWSHPRELASVKMDIVGPQVTLEQVAKLEKGTGTIPPDESLSFQIDLGQLRKLDPTPTGPINLLKAKNANAPVIFKPQGQSGWYAHIELEDRSIFEVTLQSKN